MGKFYSTKTYGTDRGLSCCFRQWRAKHSHCSTLHGYSIGVKVIFECESLDERNWVMDFGGLKDFKNWLDYMFDHTLLIAEDDPHISTFRELSNIVDMTALDLESSVAYKRGAVCDLRIVPGVGCERFAEMAYQELSRILHIKLFDGKLLNHTVRVKSVEVFEHAGNSAIYEG
jgi:6-pyruvoyltetrahydropterin/6-carboxytetrahydropterin synthase